MLSWKVPFSFTKYINDMIIDKEKIIQQLVKLLVHYFLECSMYICVRMWYIWKCLNAFIFYFLNVNVFI